LAATRVLVGADALIDKIIGDQAAGIFVPGFAGPQHARRAIRAAEEILRVTGHFNTGKPWISLGAGVQTGIAFIGSVGSKDGTHDITVLGDAPNLAARLSSAAREGEILISEPAYTAASLDWDDLEIRQLELKGKMETVSAHVLAAERSIVD
jgi:class 3 adenylate cyclase